MLFLHIIFGNVATTLPTSIRLIITFHEGNNILMDILNFSNEISLKELK